MSSLKVLLFKVSAIGIVARAVSALSGIALTPMIIGSIGVDGYAQYSFAASIATFLAVADQGLAAGVRRIAAQNQTICDQQLRYQADSALVASGLKLSLALVIIIAAIASIALLAQTSHSGAADAVLLFYIIPASFLLPLFTYCRYLEGKQETQFVLACQLISTLTFSVAVLLMSSLQAGLTYLLLCLAASQLPALLLIARKARIWPIPLQLFRSGVQVVSTRVLTSLSWPMLVTSSMLALSYATDPWILSVTHGSDAVALYGLSSKMNQAVFIALTATFPVLSSFFATRHSTKRTAIFKLSMLYVIAATLLNVPLVSAAPSIVGGFSGWQLHSDPSLILALGAFNVALAFQLPLAASASDRSGLRFQAATTTAMAAVNVPLSYFMAKLIGVSGPVWASAVALLVVHAGPLSLYVYRSPKVDRVLRSDQVQSASD